MCNNDERIICYNNLLVGLGTSLEEELIYFEDSGTLKGSITKE